MNKFKNKLPPKYACWGQLHMDLKALGDNLDADHTLIYRSNEFTSSEYLFTAHFVEKKCFDEVQKIYQDFIAKPVRDMEAANKLVFLLERYFKIPSTLKYFFNYEIKGF